MIPKLENSQENHNPDENSLIKEEFEAQDEITSQKSEEDSPTEEFDGDSLLGKSMQSDNSKKSLP